MFTVAPMSTRGARYSTRKHHTKRIGAHLQAARAKVARRVVELLAREPDTAVVLTTSGGESVLDASEVIGVQDFDPGLLVEMRRLAKDIRSRFGRLDVDLRGFWRRGQPH